MDVRILMRHTLIFECQQTFITSLFRVHARLDFLTNRPYNTRRTVNLFNDYGALFPIVNFQTSIIYYDV